ncbi:MAG: hypothetical protein F6K30_30635 [Cyanothece sp. SIO2G6]|nr:hypothetical protein [Cyanothece sp. SIO2G6]
MQGEFTNRNDHFRSEHRVHHDGPLPILINESLAEQLYPSKDPINQIVYKGHYRRDMLIKGVVSDFKIDLYDPPRPGFYIPYDYHATKNRFLVWHIKTTGNRAETVNRIRKVITDFNSAVPVIQFKTIEDHLGREFRTLRAGSIISSGLAVIGIFLSGLGIWSILRSEITNRKREIAIRTALGCKTWRLLAIIVKDMIKTVVFGLAIGIILAALTVHQSKTVLFDSDPLALGIYIQATVLIVTAGLLSATGPLTKLWQSSPSRCFTSES